MSAHFRPKSVDETIERTTAVKKILRKQHHIDTPRHKTEEDKTLRTTYLKCLNQFHTKKKCPTYHQTNMNLKAKICLSE